MQYLLLAVIVMEVTVQVDKYFLYNDVAAEFGAMAGLNVSLTTVCLGLLYAEWIPRWVRQSMYPDRRRIEVNWALVGYVAVTAFSIVLATDRKLTFYYLAILIQSFLLYHYLANNLRSKQDVKFVCLLIVLAVLLEGALMLAVQALGRDIFLGPIEITRDPESLRMQGTLRSPNLAASCMALLLSVSVAWFYSNTRNRTAVTVAALALGGIGFLLTGSRGAMIGAALTGTLVSTHLLRRGWISWRVLGPLFLLAVIAVVALQSVDVERISGDDKGSAKSRLPLAKMALAMISEHPFGIGANNCAVVAKRYHGMLEFREQWFYTVHCKYLLVWLETGVLGLLGFVAFLVGTVRTSWKSWVRWQSSDPFLAVLSLCIAAAVVGQMLHMTVEIFAARPQIQTLWMVAALGAAVHTLPDDEVVVT